MIDDDLVEARVGAGLVEERHLGRRTPRGAFGSSASCVAPAQVLGRDERVQELLEPVERVAVVEDDGGDRAAVELARRGDDDAVAQPLHDRVA